MSEALKRVRRVGGPGAKLAVAVGRPREIIVDTDTWDLTVHDGMTPGGHRTLGARGDGSEVSVKVPGATTARRMRDRVHPDPEDFGAAGDGVTDDHVALQAWLDWHKARGRDLILPAKTYRTTKSLDATMSGSDLTKSLTLHGRSRWGSKILGDLDEAYPILDIAGNYLGSVENLSVEGTSDGLATCAVYIGKNSNGGACGHSCMVRHCNINMPMVPFGGAAAAGLVIYSADLSGADGCYITGPVGVSFGGQNYLGVTSKYQSFEGFDSTKHEFTDCTVYGVDAAYWYADGIAATFRGGYAAVVGVGPSADPKAVVLVGDGNPPGGSTNSVRAYDFRTENQSTAVGVHSFALLSGSLHASRFEGSFDSDGALVYVPAGKTLASAHINAFSARSGSADTIFAGGGQVLRSRIVTNRVTVGDIAANSGGNDFVGQVLSSVLAEAPAGGDIVHTTTGAFLTPGVKGVAGLSGGSPVLTRLGQTWLREPWGFSAYAAGAEALVMSRTIPLSALLAANSAPVYPAVRIDILAVTTSAPAGTRLRLVLEQGGSAGTVADMTLANAHGWGDSCNLSLELMDNSGGGLAAYLARCAFPGEAGLSDKSYNLGWSLASDVTLRVYVTSAAADPFYVARVSGQLL